jgi:hypothetical protein
LYPVGSWNLTKTQPIRTYRIQKNAVVSRKFMLHLKLLEKQEEDKPKTSRRREIIKIRAQTNKIEQKHIKKKQNKKLVLQKNKQD